MMKNGMKPKKKMYGGAMKKKKKKLAMGGKPDYIDLDKDGKLNLIVINENILNNYTLE